MCTDVAGISTLRDSAVGVWRTIGVDLLGAVILVITFALLALHTGLDLRSDTDAVANLDCADFGADLDGLSNDFMTDTKGQRHLTPAAIDAVDV